MLGSSSEKAKVRASSAGDECKKPIDLLFILDSSERVTVDNWLILNNATQDIVEKFDMNSTRFGIIQYNSYAEVPLPLSSFKEVKELKGNISRIFYKTGGTRTDLAVTKANEIFKTAPSRKASRVGCPFFSVNPYSLMQLYQSRSASQLFFIHSSSNLIHLLMRNDELITLSMKRMQLREVI